MTKTITVSTIDTTTEPRQPKRLEKKIIGGAPFDGITVREVFDCPVTSTQARGPHRGGRLGGSAPAAQGEPAAADAAVSGHGLGGVLRAIGLKAARAGQVGADLLLVHTDGSE